MKKMSLLALVLGYLLNVIIPLQAATIPDEIYDGVNHKLLVMARKRMLTAMHGAREKLLHSPSYLQGIDISFGIDPLTLTILDKETGNTLVSPDFSIPLDDLYDIPAKYKEIIQPGIFDLYNMYTPVQFFSSGEYYIVVEDGMQRGAPGLVEYVFRSAESGEFSFELGENNRYRVTTNLRAFVGGSAFLRTEQYALKGKIFFSDTDRTANGGKVVYKWIGPRQAIVPAANKFTSESIIDNKFSFLEANGPASAEYDIKLEGIFCGCSVDVEHDRIFDPYGSTNQKLKTVNLVEATVKGRLLIDLDDEEEPLEDVEVVLKGACSEADKCMGEVESVKTDSEGRFEFKKVPKGVYSLMYQGQKVGTISNCDFLAPEVDAGDFKVSVPFKYELIMTHRGGPHSGLKELKIKWKNIVIRPMGDGVPLAIYTGGGTETDPTDSEGRRLMPPYEVKMPGMPYRMVYFGFSYDDQPELLSIRSTYGVGCHLDLGRGAPTHLFFEYGDYPGVQYPRPLAHHFEIDVSLMCGPMQVMFQYMTGYKLPEGGDHYNSQMMVAPQTVKNWKKCEDFSEQFVNTAGGHIKFEYKCLGPVNGDNQDDDPGECDEFEEDCGDDNPPADPPSDGGNDNGGQPPGMGDGEAPSIPPGTIGDIIGEIGGMLGGLFGN